MANKVTQASLRRELGLPGNLLTPPDSNPKLFKSSKKDLVFTYGLSLAPADISGHDVCPGRSPGCTAACLFTAGNPVYAQAKKQGRIRKTKALFANRDAFMNLLALEMHAAIEKQTALGHKIAFRLNVLSDIVWERRRFFIRPEVADKIGYDMDKHVQPTLIELFPKVTFYDYTKIKDRKPPKNYHLTFSLSEINEGTAKAEFASGKNVAAVFPYGKVPDTLWGHKVINGDESDYRPGDPKHVIVGLQAKGLAKQDTSGFVNQGA